MLYNDDETWSPATTDYNNIIVTHYGSEKYVGGSTTEIKIIIASGVQKYLGSKAGDVIRLIHRSLDYSYRTVVRALVSKIPGFYFSNYFQDSTQQNALVSVPQYKQILDDIWGMMPTKKEDFDVLTETFDLVDGIPKDMLFVRLNPDIPL